MKDAGKSTRPGKETKIGRRENPDRRDKRDRTDPSLGGRSQIRIRTFSIKPLFSEISFLFLESLNI